MSPLKLGRIGWTSTGNNQGRFPSWRCIWKKEKHFNYWSHFISLRNVLLAFYSVWFPHIIDRNYIVIKISNTLFINSKGKNEEVFPKIFDSICSALTHGEGQDNIVTLTFGNTQKNIWPRWKLGSICHHRCSVLDFPDFDTYACLRDVT